MRKLKFDKPAELQEKIDRYFETIGRAEKPPTLSGLALFLGTTRQTLYDYIEKAGSEEGRGKQAQCGEILMMAKAQIECYLEEKLLTNYSKGVEFALTNGYAGWGRVPIKVEGKVEQEHKGEMKVAQLSDEELMERLKVLQERANEIRAKEGAADGADGSRPGSA